MQMFIIGSVLETAKILDKKRLNKQIVECYQILNALNGSTKAWRNHPCTIQYQEHIEYIKNYILCLESYKNNDLILASKYNDICEKLKPSFHNIEYFNQMKRRLYTKNKEHYSQFAYLGESQINWYYVDNQWKYYLNGKVVKK
ncbi:MAG: hypothetical protein IKT40_09510 [Bacilli bacterium]|nr:hypothetical protein [Bacilli bacterium]